jgi:single-strand DNA-binding protein
MNALNSVIVEGNVVKKPEIRKTPKGTDVCTLGVAVNRWYKGLDGEMQQEVSFFDVNAWGALANACTEKCDKGRGVRVVGRLKQSRWVDQAGKNKSRVIIEAEHVEFKKLQDKKDDPAYKDLADAAAAQAAELEAGTF